MNTLLTTILVGVSLSMDAFSLSLIYGTYSLSKKEIYLLSGIVGVFHFFMPLLGLFFGEFVSRFLFFNIDFIVGIIFGIIGIEMVVSSFKDDDNVNFMVNVIGFLFFGLSVSIDSFTIGIGLSLISNNYLMCSIIFMLVSSFFTYVGLNCGNKLSNKFGKLSTIFGGFIMIILAITYFF